MRRAADLGVGAKFQNVAGLPIERDADAFERVETNASHLAGLEQRYVLLGDANAFRQFLRAHLAAGEHDVEIDDDRHRRPPHTKPAFSSARRAPSRITEAMANKAPPTIS